MRIEAYLRVLGCEHAIRAIHEATNLPDAEIMELKARVDPVGKEIWWNWQTVRVPIDIDKTDEGLKELLLAHRSIFPIIRKYKETDIYLEVVMQYEEGEEPWGLYMSVETITLLGEMGGALDVDAVTLLKKSHK